MNIYVYEPIIYYIYTYMNRAWARMLCSAPDSLDSSRSLSLAI